ncbi:winged helix-turn-helix domain-containing protein [Halosimplex salinum]|uniref:winged helix-turn-helix domain-containing protein n=1 Tax=Halosimplex salinum TaxID=1710538 RepID=UPI001F2F5DCF|nr:helix-turn-helix transcriptional regulator [Halosimplex salinum]
MSPPDEGGADGTTDADGGESGAPAGAMHVDPAAAFASLSDPLRVDILRALAAFHREAGPDSVGFADLRRRVDVRDSGRFRYHLNELRDHFVEKADGGYRLTHAGLEVVAAILAGTYTGRGSMEPEPLDSDCSVCGSPAVATYENGVCAVVCEAGHPLFHWSLPPAAAADATLPEVVSLTELFARQAIERALAGVCPKCSGPVDPAVVAGSDDTDPDADADGEEPSPRLRVRCDTCGARLVGPVGFCLLVDPAVAAFYRRHDRPLDELHVWEPAFVDGDAVSVADTDPVRIDVDVSLDGDALAVSVDDSGSVSVRDS